MERKNKRGNRVERYFFPVDRSYFDSKNKVSSVWERYETDKDSRHFGIWVCAVKRQIITFDKGDITRVYCATEKSFRAEVKAMDDLFNIGETAVV